MDTKLYSLYEGTSRERSILIVTDTKEIVEQKRKYRDKTMKHLLFVKRFVELAEPNAKRYEKIKQPGSWKNSKIGPRVLITPK